MSLRSWTWIRNWVCQAARPSGFSKEGLPLALQIAGRPFAEATILRVAHAYEGATEWHLRHPDLQESIAKAA